ncbi:protein FAM124B-like [Oncorhynchus masou masou]|uniref:protein FAM124B-like n=1 Tax=Oncorhynchus masou masou TaxID=90313 RepID=UPI0031839E62
MLQVTLYSGYDNFDDTVRLYEAVLQSLAEEQKPGFCWFTLYTEPERCLQLALKTALPPLGQGGGLQRSSAAFQGGGDGSACAPAQSMHTLAGRRPGRQQDMFPGESLSDP